MTTLWLAQEEAADALLASNPFALLMGMILDQQIPLQKAFKGPLDLQERLGKPLTPELIAHMDPDELVQHFLDPKPGLHRFPAAMAKRVQEAAEMIVEEYDGDTEAIWADAKSGAELVKNIEKIPGFGKDKSRIFAALLAKRFDVTPRGWIAASKPFGDKGVFRSVADIVDEESWKKTRVYKKKVKAAAAAKA